MFQSLWGGAWGLGFSHCWVSDPAWSGESPGWKGQAWGLASSSCVRRCAVSPSPRASATCGVPWHLHCRTLYLSSDLNNLWFLLILCAWHTYSFNFIPWNPQVTKLATGSKNILQQCKVFFFFFLKAKTKPFYMSLSHHFSLQSLRLEYWISLFILRPLTLCVF